ncbi:MAG TPA: type II toxin-antitoxin system PemK/MazF family toxin [Tepidisphaeraceae bacterium]|jgi:mRNA interferase MazF|nr:type II toxin-antitoxin system PemK/MazF family toxin [Tepidisphaeraceae bacterium]
MSYRSYIPKRGDLVHMNFSPSAGHEMADRHFGLVLSALEYNRKSRMAIVCPISSRSHDWPFEVLLPVGLLPAKKGVGIVTSVIIADGVRQVDYREREMAFVSQAPAAILEQVLDRLFAIIETE